MILIIILISITPVHKFLTLRREDCPSTPFKPVSLRWNKGEGKWKLVWKEPSAAALHCKHLNPFGVEESQFRCFASWHRQTLIITICDCNQNHLPDEAVQDVNIFSISQIEASWSIEMKYMVTVCFSHTSQLFKHLQASQ